jgi:hypothetical protein
MSESLVADRIESNLTRLRLPRIREVIESVIETAQEQGKSYLSGASLNFVPFFDRKRP